MSTRLLFTMMLSTFFVTTPVACGQTGSTVQRTKNPVELGLVKWIRNFDDGLAETKAKGRPMLLLFQEVPG